MNKKKITIILITAMLLNLLGGCGALGGCTNNKISSNQNENTNNESVQETKAAVKINNDYITNTGYNVLELCSTDSEIFDVLKTVKLAKEPKNLGKLELIDFSITTVSITKLEPVEDSEVKATIKMDLINNKKLLPVVDRDYVIEGDTCNIDYVGYIDGREFSGGKDEGYDLKIGSGTFIPGFEEGLIGKRAKQKVNVNVTFPEDYQSPLLAGRKALFVVTINEIKEEKEEPYDEKYVAEHTETGAKTIAEYEEEIKNLLVEEKKSQLQQDVYQQIYQKMLENSKFEATQEGLAYIFSLQLDDVKTKAELYGQSFEDFAKQIADTPRDFVNKIKEICPQVLKGILIQRELAKEYNINITDEDRINFAKAYLEQSGISEAKDDDIMQVIKYLGIEQIDNQLTMSEVMPKLKDKVIIEYVGE